MDNENTADSEPKGLLGRRRKLYAVAAAGAVLAVGAAALIGLLPRDPGTVIASAGIIQGDVRIRAAGENNWQQLRGATAPLFAGTSLSATSSGRIGLDLPAQASVRLDAGSELTLVAAREVALTAGTVYVDTGTDPAAGPFTIVTALGTVQAIGAQAAIGLAGDALRVSVRSGDVEITQAGSDIPFAATAGEGLQLTAAGLDRRVSLLTFGDDWAWVETLSSTPDVNGTTLTAFLSWVAREIGRPLRFDEPTTEARAATVTLDVDVEGLDPVQALDIVLSTTEFDYGGRYDGSIVVRPRDD